MPEQYRRGTIVVAGALAQRPCRGGHTWVFLQYLLGFRRLGWDVLFVDRLEPDMCVDALGRPAPLENSINLRYFRDVMQQFGLADSCALYYDRGTQVIGLSREQVQERTRDAAFLLNVMGYIDDAELLAAASRRVFLDIDPGFGQMWRMLGLHDLFAGHDTYVTIGENIGRPECTIPECGIDWITTHQPVVLDHWRANAPPRGASFTSIGAWRGPFSPITYDGRSYGLRVHEFRKFFELPRRLGQQCDVALDIHAAETGDLALLADNGWTVIDPLGIASDPWSYRAYIHGAKAEFMVAKGMYVTSRSGWFSDRSICFLASGRPVLAQDTGLRDLYPVGEGLLTFSTLAEAIDGAADIAARYAQHAKAASDIARTYFDSDVVLSRLLCRLGAG